MPKLITIILILLLITIGCSTIRKRDTDSIRIEIIEAEVSYRDGDILQLNLILTNQSYRDAVITDQGRSFRLDAPPGSQFPGWTGEWFVGIEDRECGDGCMSTLGANSSDTIAVKFSPLHSTTRYPELDLMALFHVTVKLDGIETTYSARSSDTVKVITDREAITRKKYAGNMVAAMMIVEDRVLYHHGDTLELRLIMSNGGDGSRPISTHPGAFWLEHYRTPFSPYALFQSVDGGYPMDSLPILGAGQTDTLTVRFVRSRADVEFDSVAVRAVYDFGVERDSVLKLYHLHGLDHVVVVVEK